MPNFITLIQALAEGSINPKVTQLEPRRTRRQKARDIAKINNKSAQEKAG